MQSDHIKNQDLSAYGQLPHDSSPAIVDQLVERLDAVHTAREQAVNAGRQVIRTSANAIRALHRGEFTAATSLLDDAATTLQAIRNATASHPAVYWAGYVQDAMKEYAEAAITAAILQELPIPPPEALQVEDAAYLNALAEAASELRRDCLDALRAEDTDRAMRLLDRMDGIYAELVTVDFPDAMTGGLRRTTDQLRAVLERTRGDVTLAIRQDRLETALRSLEDRMG
jgi:translin